MKFIKLLLIILLTANYQTVSAGEEAKPVHRQKVEGQSSFSLYGASIKCKLKKIGEKKNELEALKEDLLILYDKSKTPEEPIIEIKSAWGGALSSPQYVHAKIYKDELIVLLYTPSVFHLFIRQRYKKEDGGWSLVSENPIQKMSLYKVDRLVAAEVTGRNEVTFYFHSYAESSGTGQPDSNVRKIFEGQPHKNDYKLVYQFTDWTAEDKLNFENREIKYEPEVLGDKVKLNGADYSFMNSDAYSPIPGYKPDEDE